MGASTRMRRAASWIVTAVVLSAFLAAPIAAARAQQSTRKAVFILDSSGSMWAQIRGVNRVVIAREALAQAFTRYRDAFELGVASYGHNRAPNCGQVQMLLPIGPIDPQAYSEEVEKHRPRGAGSIGASLEFAARALEADKRPASIILLADGPDNCQVDICAVARDLAASSRDLAIHVIAFAVRDREVMSALKCVAAQSRGGLFEASDKPGLIAAVNRAFAAARADAGRPVEARTRLPAAQPPQERASQPPAAGGTVTGSLARETGTAPEVTGLTETATQAAPEPEAVPSLKDETLPDTGASADDSAEAEPPSTVPPRPVPAPPRRKPEAIAAGAETPAPAEAPAARIARLDQTARMPAPRDGPTPEFEVRQETAKNSGIRLAARISRELEPIRKDVAWSVYRVDRREPDKWIELAAESAAEPKFVLEPGEYVVRARYGHARASKALRVAKGKLTVATFIFNAGALKLMPALAALETPAATPVRQSIYMDGAGGAPRRLVVADARAGRAILLNAGDFEVVSKFGRANAVVATRVSVKPGRLTEVEINHKAGIARFRLTDESNGTAIGTAHWKLVDSAGKLVIESDGEAPAHVLAPGRYKVTASFGKKSYSSIFEITAGENKVIEIVGR